LRAGAVDSRRRRSSLFLVQVCRRCATRRLSNLTADTAITTAQYDDGRRRPRHLLPLVVARIGEGGYSLGGL
jgi:hypothetical protein